MFHENENDTFKNVLPKYKITRAEKRVINKAVKAYQIHLLKNIILREEDSEWTVDEYLERYPDHFKKHSPNKLRFIGESPADILDAYFISKGESTWCPRWFNLARCVMAIGEHKAKSKKLP